jgi:hypothetical protein
MVAPPTIAGGATKNTNPGQYFGIRRIVVNNLIYIGNLHALKAWYRLVRKKFMSGDRYEQACWKGAIRRLDEAIAERIIRLEELAAKMPRSIEIGNAENNLPKAINLQQESFVRNWPAMRIILEQDTMEKIDAVSCNAFHKEWEKVEEPSYLEAISTLTPAAKTTGTAWLQSIVDLAAAQWDDK